MRVKVIPEDFVVEEQIHLPLADSGPYTLYRVHKRGVTTLAVQVQIARLLARRRSAISLPALKDRQAVAIQHASVRGGGPARLEGSGFVAERVGRAERPLAPSDLMGNRFTVIVRGLGTEEAKGLSARLEHLAQTGLPNYFDHQRFGSRTSSGDFPGRRILLRDAEGALRAHLAEPLAGDTPRVRAFKRLAAEEWRHWDLLLEAAPRPSNFRSVLTFLCDHPTDFRRALNLIAPRLLSLYLTAYQSLLWNRIAARYLTARLGEPTGAVLIANEPLPLFEGLAAHIAADAAIPLPHHHAHYSDPLLAAVVGQVLAAEGLALNDLKPRILERAYLPRGGRRLLLLPQEVTASPPIPDDRFPGRLKMTLVFALPPGSYATLVLRALGDRKTRRARKEFAP